MTKYIDKVPLSKIFDIVLEASNYFSGNTHNVWTLCSKITGNNVSDQDIKVYTKNLIEDPSIPIETEDGPAIRKVLRQYKNNYCAAKPQI